MEVKNVLEIYEKKRERVQEFNLTNDLFAGKVFEDVEASRELCSILMQKPGLRLKSVRTQYVIRNLQSHSVQLDFLAGWHKCAAAVSSISEFEARMAGITSEAGSKPY